MVQRALLLYHAQGSTTQSTSQYTTMKIAIENINSAAITAQARKNGITEVTKLASGPNVTIYQCGDVRVADTNADPVWEESVAGEDWLAMLAEEGIDL
jgi:hypothetical protein